MQKHFIGGQWGDGSDGRTLPVVDPGTGEAFDELARGNADDIDRAVRLRARRWPAHGAG